MSSRRRDSGRQTASTSSGTDAAVATASTTANATDIATTGSGNFAPHFRRANSLQYTSPDLNGFQGSFRLLMDGGSDKGGVENIAAVTARPERAAGCVTDAADTTPVALDGNGQCPTAGDTYEAMRSEVQGVTAHQRNGNGGNANVDEWALSAKYGVRGFTIAGAYEVQPDKNIVVNTYAAANATTIPGVTGSRYKQEDATFWAVRGGYSQDNWAVNAWYGQHNTSDTVGPRAIKHASNNMEQADDTTIVSFSGNIDIGKVGLVAIHETRENEWGVDDTATIMNVNYHFTSKSRVYGAYIANDFDSDTTKDDEVRIGLRMDF